MLTLTEFPKNRLVIIDVDTTGLDRKINELIAIHAFEIINNKLSGIFFHIFLNKRENKTEYMNYLSDYEYTIENKKKLSFFCKFIENERIVSHNIKFDIGFINLELEKVGFNIIKEQDCVCTLRIFRNILRRSKLENVADLYEININHDDYHKGIVDATVLARIVCKMNENDDNYYNIEKYATKFKIIENKIQNIEMDNNIDDGNENNLDCIKNSINILKYN